MSREDPSKGMGPRNSDDASVHLQQQKHFGQKPGPAAAKNRGWVSSTSCRPQRGRGAGGGREPRGGQARKVRRQRACRHERSRAGSRRDCARSSQRVPGSHRRAADSTGRTAFRSCQNSGRSVHVRHVGTHKAGRGRGRVGRRRVQTAETTSKLHRTCGPREGNHKGRQDQQPQNIHHRPRRNLPPRRIHFPLLVQGKHSLIPSPHGITRLQPRAMARVSIISPASISTIWSIL